MLSQTQAEGKHCPRCGTSMLSFSMSWFNQEEICLDCKEDEKQCPNYVRAREAELADLQAGNLRFAGIGLAVEDVVVLRRLRAARWKGGRDGLDVSAAQ